MLGGNPRLSGLIALNVQNSERIPRSVVPKDKFVFVDDEVLNALMEGRFTLLGAVLGATLTTTTVIEFLKRFWKDHLPTIRSYDGVSQLRFSRSEDLEWVVDQGPWLVDGNKPFMLRRWDDVLGVDMRSFGKVQVWATLPDLHFLFWSASMIGKIGCMIGDPVCLDSDTAMNPRQG